MVKRYDWYSGDGEPWEYGDYVTYTDYAELQARADALEAALRFYADEDNQYPNNGPWGVYSDDFGSRARIALAQHGKVK